MGLFSGVTDFLGLTNTKGMDQAAAAAQFNPFSIQSSFGGVDYDRANRLFTSRLDPRLTGISDQFIGQLGQIDPQQQLGLMRQQAAPYNQAMSQNQENRLFSQGRLDHSQAYQPGGAMRGLWDAQLNQDLSFQQQAQQQALMMQQGLLGNIGSIQGMEMGLFSPAQQMGAIGQQGASMGAQIQAQGASMMPNFMQNLIGGASMGYMMRPG